MLNLLILKVISDIDEIHNYLHILTIRGDIIMEAKPITLLKETYPSLYKAAQLHHIDYYTLKQRIERWGNDDPRLFDKPRPRVMHKDTEQN